MSNNNKKYLTVIGLPIDYDWRILDPRVVSAMQNIDLLIAEERRNGKRLLAAVEKRETELILLNEHSEIQERKFALERVLSVKNSVFVSDAGTPCIADPDYEFIEMCINNGIIVKSVPGPSSITTALSVSGMRADKFIYLGFPPREEKDRSDFFKNLISYRMTAVFMERPYALKRTLEELSRHKLDISISIALGTEDELILRGSPNNILKQIKSEIKAPFTVCVKA